MYTTGRRYQTEEVLDFLLSAPTPEAVIALRPSLLAQERLRYLLYPQHP